VIDMSALELQPAVENSRLSDSVYDTLVEAILAGRLKPGSVVSELELARQFKVSRTPVHDALRQLTKDGLVVQEMNRRAVIAAFTAEDVYDIFEMRKLLEGEASKRAATQLDRIAQAALREASEKMGAALAKPNAIPRWVDYDETFHMTIVSACGSKRLTQDIARYRLLHRTFNRLRTTPEVLRQALAEHFLILEALEKREPKAAATQMVAHIHEWQAYFVNRFQKADR
jgi:GntR family transcriptional regulator, rspAB operon transcriptional repressor